MSAPLNNGFAPGLDSTGKNNGTTEIHMDQSVLKKRTDNTTCLSNYIGPGEQIVSSALSVDE